ncbi:hypothetical protein [Olivibacter domesticus]|uniref:Uncharacterized protein n=1 Tax=Olivibacter domesticus TaxID=407022 RepID=A0A1H7QM23_OLID1|nr:hypothetical protein [Olivibacter domesticus]SEL48287.1 hypothetical protein SAMN05661044_02623 [Olivibacter domesticus]
MRTSLNKLKFLENYIENQLLPEEKLLLDARIIIDEELKDELYCQEKTYQIIRAYGRENLRAQLTRVEHELFVNPVHKKFIDKIKDFFKK